MWDMQRYNVPSTQYGGQQMMWNVDNYKGAQGGAPLASPVAPERKFTKSQPFQDKRGGRRVFVARVPFETTQEDLLQHFQSFGEITDVYCPRDPYNPSSNKGFGFVSFKAISSAQQALKWAPHVIRGREVVVDFAVERSDEENAEMSPRVDMSSSYDYPKVHSGYNTGGMRGMSSPVSNYGSGSGTNSTGHGRSHRDIPSSSNTLAPPRRSTTIKEKEVPVPPFIPSTVLDTLWVDSMQSDASKVRCLVKLKASCVGASGMATVATIRKDVQPEAGSSLVEGEDIPNSSIREKGTEQADVDGNTNETDRKKTMLREVNNDTGEGVQGRVPMNFNEEEQLRCNKKLVVDTSKAINILSVAPMESETQDVGDVGGAAENTASAENLEAGSTGKDFTSGADIVLDKESIAKDSSGLDNTEGILKADTIDLEGVKPYEVNVFLPSFFFSKKIGSLNGDERNAVVCTVNFFATDDAEPIATDRSINSPGKGSSGGASTTAAGSPGGSSNNVGQESGSNTRKPPPGGNEWIRRGHRIHVGQLNASTSAEHLKCYFQQFGEVVDAYIPKDHALGVSRGFGFVTFLDPTIVESLVWQTQPHELNGNRIYISRARPS
ncbi:hypothetical protein IE077_000123 [Cardiosporidium cionae]|uniref:RRM domain-containing protein n=1 Tax=Cardiosporidium cionae TaxID=476202 RepID=A0ABQ7JD79_9APIC|nr:hypothetical protein IE077_000123 [Cardiosporidium cionae]|eukprot:KAF8821977.1 hypothetical protein IE077_000123 [Cardiosporidium cionae]